MDDLITLRTSDDPPVELKAARSVLVAGSKVFSDMLSLPQSATTRKDGSIDVAETQSELTPFLRLLNLSHDEGKPLEELKVDDWPVVARLADKYDSNAVVGLSLGMYWKWRAENYGSTANLASASQGRKAQFDTWLSALKLHAFEYSIKAVSEDDWCRECQRKVHGVKDHWERAMLAAMQAWEPCRAGCPFDEHLRPALKRSNLCGSCQITKVQRFTREFRETAPECPL